MPAIRGGSRCHESAAKSFSFPRCSPWATSKCATDRERKSILEPVSYADMGRTFVCNPIYLPYSRKENIGRARVADGKIRKVLHVNRNKKGGWLVAIRPFCVWGVGENRRPLIAAEGPERAMAQHAEMPIEGMLALEEREHRCAPWS